jgi:hypothetical protein
LSLPPREEGYFSSHRVKQCAGKESARRQVRGHIVALLACLLCLVIVLSLFCLGVFSQRVPLIPQLSQHEPSVMFEFFLSSVVLW